MAGIELVHRNYLFNELLANGEGKNNASISFDSSHNVSYSKSLNNNDREDNIMFASESVAGENSSNTTEYKKKSFLLKLPSTHGDSGKYR